MRPRPTSTTMRRRLLDPRVFGHAAYLPSTGAGNRQPAEAVSIGQERPRTLLIEARRQGVPPYLQRKPEEIVFTSGATESNNLALLGLMPHGLDSPAVMTRASMQWPEPASS